MVVENALLTLDRDWILVGRKVKQSPLLPKTMDFKSCKRRLVKLGYLAKEVEAIQKLAACTKCLTLKRHTNFEVIEINEPGRLRDYSELKYRKTEKPSNPNRDHMCVKCLLDRKVSPSKDAGGLCFPRVVSSRVVVATTASGARTMTSVVVSAFQSYATNVSKR